MSKIKIAIQGELGAYSHIAVEKLYQDAEIKTCSTFEDTFKQAYNDPAYKIIIPIENSLAGRVADCLLYTSPSPRDVEESRMPSSA